MGQASSTRKSSREAPSGYPEHQTPAQILARPGSIVTAHAPAEQQMNHPLAIEGEPEPLDFEKLSAMARKQGH